MRTFADVIKDLEKRTPQERAIERAERDKAVRYLKAICKAKAQDENCKPLVIHDYLNGPLSMGNGNELVLHESEIWEIVEHAYRRARVF